LFHLQNFEMSVKIIPRCVVNAKLFFQETILSGRSISSGSKFLYSKEDVDWMTNIWIKNYDKIKENPYNYYMTLTLLNRNTKSGRFALIYNDLVYASVEKRKEKDFLKLLLHPEFTEINDNKYFDEKERNHWRFILKCELTAINLLMKKQENSKKIQMIPSPLYNECFIQVSFLFNKDIDIDLLKYTSFESTNFITLSEYNENTDTYHMYSFDLIDLILLVVFKENNIYTNKPFSEQNLENINTKYSTEIKMVRRSYGK